MKWNEMVYHLLLQDFLLLGLLCLFAQLAQRN
jgi:hypothetical protein